MTPDGKPEKEHLRTDKYVSASAYRSPGSAPRPRPVPEKNRGEHGAAMMQSVEELKHDYDELRQTWEGQEQIRARGLIVEFESPPDV